MDASGTSDRENQRAIHHSDHGGVVAHEPADYKDRVALDFDGCAGSANQGEMASLSHEKNLETQSNRDLIHLVRFR